MEQIVYLVTMGIFFIVAVVLLCWVLYHRLTEKNVSIWRKQHLSMQTGILIMIVLALISYYIFYTYYRDRGANHVFALVSLASSLIIVQCGLSVYSLSDRRRIAWKDYLLNYIVPILLLLGYYALIINPVTIDYSIWLLVVAGVYYIGFVLHIYKVSMRNSAKFQQRLEDNYVEMDKRQIMYRSHAIVYCVSILGCWVLFVLNPDYILHSCYFVISTVGWTYFSYVVVNLKDSPLANTMQAPPANEPDEVVLEPTEKELQFDSPVMQRLHAEIDTILLENGLYLDPDLDISMLARALGTNRTYIGRLLRLRGTSFSRYINTLRLTHAEELLRTTNKSVREVCDDCGFSDATFRRVFADRYNCTPMDYRRRLKGY